MLLVLCFVVSDWLKLFLICRPFRYSWDKSIKGHCGKVFTGWLLIGTGNLFLDVGTIVLPLPQLWRLQLPTGKKAELTALFSIGAL